MNPRALRVLYEVLATAGLNPALAAADMPDTRLVELVEGAAPLRRGHALDKARSRAVGAAASARFIHADVTKLSDLGIGDGYNLIVDSGCYYGLSGDQRDAYATGVTRVAAQEALPLIGRVHQDSRRGWRDRRR